jgi:galactose mutarotase-like enzyme
MRVQGTITEGVIFGNPLRLTRRITAKLGENRLCIDDTVENLGGEATPHMMLYHFNLGFPLLSPASHFVVNSRRITPRMAMEGDELAQYATFQPPTPGYSERVFYHDPVTDNAGNVLVALVNPELDGGLGIYFRYHQKTLPNLVQWKMMGYGSYVLGIEPANCLVDGRAKERESGRLVMLQPGESRDYHVEFGVLDGASEIEACVGEIKAAV